MKEGPNIAQIAALIGDPARANILTALLSGKALTGTELAGEAGITVQTASSHLAKLSAGGLVVHQKQGRHKYYALAGTDVAHVLEGLMGLAAGAGHLRTRTGPKDAALRTARVCYNHLAGEVGTTLFDRLMSKGHITEHDGAVALTETGRAHMERFGIDVTALESQKAPLCKSCLDWSERRYHLAGSLGRAFFARLEDLNWATRATGSRVVVFSQTGQVAFDRWVSTL